MSMRPPAAGVIQGGHESDHLEGVAQLELEGGLAASLVAGEVVQLCLDLQDAPLPAGEEATASMGLSPVGTCWWLPPLLLLWRCWHRPQSAAW